MVILWSKPRLIFTTNFEINNDAVEVLIFKGKKQISIDRDFTLGPQYHRLFRKRYEK